MRSEVFEQIRNQPEYHAYLRTHPEWYRKLSRDPGAIAVMIKESDVYYGKTIPQRISKVQQSLQLAVMMMDMMRQVGEQ